MQVNILSRKFIRPSTPTSPHLQKQKLTFFDQLAPPVHVPLVFFYTPDHDETKVEEKLHQLEKSLSEILALYYPLAGRFIKDDLLIDCNDQGAGFFQAKANVQLMEFLNDGPKAELLDSFVPWEIGAATSATAPIVAVQVTVFECGGLAVCFHGSHVVLDGFSGCTFVHEWATASRLGIGQVVSPSFDLASLFPSRDLSEVEQFPPPKSTEKPKVLTRRLVFDSDTISILKDKITKLNSSENERPPTRVEAVMSTIWNGIIHAGRAKHQKPLKSFLMSLPLNLRGRTGLPVPENACGNFYVAIPATFTPKKETKMELHHLVGSIRGAIRSKLASCAKISNNEEMFSMIVHCVNDIRRAITAEEMGVQNFTTLCGFPIYETDFGWGKPVLVSNVRVPVGIVPLLDTKCGNGVEAWVSLEEPCMLEFEKDPNIVGLVTRR